ncbi:Centrosomal protein of 19 kDa [Kappamyces sp. JEL0829]|nr:Centrosomal protein of 19 kDa [Kappamyces sp. JEL0829]
MLMCQATEDASFPCDGFLQSLVERVLAHHNIKFHSKSVQQAKGADLPLLPAKSKPLADNAPNLNLVSDAELEKAKQLMDVDFVKNRIEKSSPDFQYDVKKDFGPAEEKCDWDSSDDESLKAPPKKETPSLVPEKSHGPLKPIAVPATLKPLESLNKPEAVPKPAESGMATAPKPSEGDKPALAPAPARPANPVDATAPATLDGLFGKPADAKAKTLEPPALSSALNAISNISTKEKSSLADDLDALLNGLDGSDAESAKSKKSSRTRHKKEKNALKEKKQAGKTAEASILAGTKTEADKPKLDEAAARSGPKSLLGDLPSLASVPAVGGLKPLGKSAVAASQDVPFAEQLVSLLEKKAVTAEPVPKASVPATPAPETRPIPESRPAAPIEIVDDISEEIVVGQDEEDEEFAAMLAKAKKTNPPLPSALPSKPDSQSAAEQTPTPDAKVADTKPMAVAQPNLDGSKSATTPSDPAVAVREEAKPVESAPKGQASLLGNLPSLAKPAAAIPSLPEPQSLSEYNYEDDFEGGHTDDEIVFSDDGLSLGSVHEDDEF